MLATLFRNILFGIALCFVGCNFESQTRKEEYRGSLNIKNNNTEFERYKQLLRTTCRLMEGCDFEYDTQNTRFFLLSGNNEDTCFVAESSIQCGCPGGSCGNDIQVIRKTGKDTKILLSLCGFTVEPEDTLIHKYRSFSYFIRSYNSKQLKINVSYSEKGFIFDTLIKGDLPYPLLKAVLKNQPECLPDLDCPLADKIILDTLKTQKKGQFLLVVKIQPDGENSPKWLLVSPEKDTYPIINSFESVNAWDTLPTTHKGYYGIRIETLFKQQIWEWNGQQYTLKKELPLGR